MFKQTHAVYYLFTVMDYSDLHLGNFYWWLVINLVRLSYIN